MTINEWTDDDSIAAQKQGWDLFTCIGSVYGDVQLQALSPEGVFNEVCCFDDDSDAWKFVNSQYKQKDPLALKAIAILSEENFTECEKVKRS